jgi:hypothetical protein
MRMQPALWLRPANMRLCQDGSQEPHNLLDVTTAGLPSAVRSRDFDWLRDILRSSGVPELGSRPDSSLNTVILRDLVYIGDGGLFLERIITPIFQALAFELSTKGGNGCEPALRITYDDANESFVLPSNVKDILRSLHVLQYVLRSFVW